MDHNPAQPQAVTFRGAMRAGMYTAQLGVSLTVSPGELILQSMGRSYRVEREQLVQITETSLLGIFKRGLQIAHRQAGAPSTLVFYPADNRQYVRQKLAELGWT